MKKMIAVMALGTVAFSTQAQSSSSLLLTLNSSNTMSQGAAMVLAGQALEQKAKVRVLLCGAGAEIAVQGNQSDTLKPKNMTPQDMLKGLIKGGATVEVCALFLPNKGLKPDALIPGVTPAKPADVASHFLRPEVKTLSF